MKQKTTPSVVVTSGWGRGVARESEVRVSIALQTRLCAACYLLIFNHQILSYPSFRRALECNDVSYSPFSFSILHRTCFCFFPFLFVLAVFCSPHCTSLSLRPIIWDVTLYSPVEVHRHLEGFLSVFRLKEHDNVATSRQQVRTKPI
jgi:hypothetical protein